MTFLSFLPAWRSILGRGRVAATRRGPAAAGILMSEGGREGPPDLDQMWRDFNRKLSQWMSGGGQGGGDGHPPTSTGLGVGLILGLVVLVWLSSGFFIVQEGYQAAVLSFGKFDRLAGPGFQWRLPYPFESDEIVPVTQLRSVDVGSNNVDPTTGLKDSFMLTQDENIVDVRFSVQYRLKDVQQFLFNNNHPDEAVRQAAESAVREIVGRTSMDSVLYEKRDAIPGELMSSIQKQLDKLQAGILITNVNLQSVQAPDQVQAAFDDALKAGADRERFKNDGEAYANEVLPKAKASAVRLQQQAEGYRARVIAQAQGDAQRFDSILAEYRKAPGVTRDRMYIDAMQQIYSNVTKVIVDGHNANNVIYLPLDKLIPAASAAAASTATSGSAAPASGGTDAGAPDSSGLKSTDARSRDDLRTRDRDVR
jgi:membrane protease subunit HflK